jgi:hypothetical protein
MFGYSFFQRNLFMNFIFFHFLYYFLTLAAQCKTASCDAICRNNFPFATNKTVLLT